MHLWEPLVFQTRTSPFPARSVFRAGKPNCAPGSSLPRGTAIAGLQTGVPNCPQPPPGLSKTLLGAGYVTERPAARLFLPQVLRRDFSSKIKGARPLRPSVFSSAFVGQFGQDLRAPRRDENSVLKLCRPSVVQGDHSPCILQDFKIRGPLGYDRLYGECHSLLHE